MKQKRQDRILELIAECEIVTQDALTERLCAEGFEVTQATVSRDIRELKLIKVANGNGGSRYAASGSAGIQPSVKYDRILAQTVNSIDTARNIAVLKTHSGMAQAAAAAIDAMKHPKLVGCIAGDDTIFAAFATDEDANEFTRFMRSTISN